MPLRDEHRDIRLFDLFPGDFDDELKVSIYQTHLPLRPGHRHEHGRRSLADLAATLPSGWDIQETLSGRYIFWQRSTNLTTWVHPDQDVSRDSYEWWEGARPSYEALSYAWGSIDNPASILVERLDGEHTDIDLLIPQNLALALRYLRFKDRTRTLWADSICINQRDLLERNSHVKRMSDIYKLAYRVVVWLGAPSESSHLAMRSLRRYAAQVDYTASRHRLSAPGALHPGWSLDASEVPFDREVWQSILDLVSRPWFDRLWVMQEVQLASHLSVIFCGWDHIDWPSLRRAIMCLRDLPGVPLADWVSRFIGLERLVGPVADTDFLRLLSRAQQRLCSDQRDKIYGVLSLASPQLASLISPDYAKPLSSVYTDAFMAVVRHTQRLEILPYCIEKPTSPPGLPSWVPDWTVFPRAPLGHRITYLMHTVTAAHTSPHMELQSDSVLEVAGVKLGTVSAIKGPAPTDEKEGAIALSAWAPNDPVYRPTGEDAADAYTLTLLHWRVDERYAYWPVTPGNVMPLAEQRKAIYDQIERGGSVPADQMTNLREPLYKIHERVLILDDRGYFGLAPGTARIGKLYAHKRSLILANYVGDIFCTILGCDEIMLLRETEPGHHKIIGPCYIHGLWDGEGLLGSMEEQWKLKYSKDKTGIDVPRFFNIKTGEERFEDPRLGPLPESWKQLVLDRSMDDPLSISWFQHIETGEISNHDPRVSPEALRSRGVDVSTFSLV